MMRTRSTALVLAVLLALPSSLLAQSSIGRVTPIAFESKVSAEYPNQAARLAFEPIGVQHPSTQFAPMWTEHPSTQLSFDSAVQAPVQPTTADVMAMLLKMQQQIDAIQSAQNGPSWIVSVLGNREVQIFLGGLGTWAMCYASKKC